MLAASLAASSCSSAAARKSGKATTFLTDYDEEVFYDLKTYLESTGAPVPPQLKNHAAAQAKPGARNERGELMNKSRDKVQYAK